MSFYSNLSLSFEYLSGLLGESWPNLKVWVPGERRRRRQPNPSHFEIPLKALPNRLDNLIFLGFPCLGRREKLPRRPTVGKRKAEENVCRQCQVYQTHIKLTLHPPSGDYERVPLKLTLIR